MWNTQIERGLLVRVSACHVKIIVGQSTKRLHVQLFVVIGAVETASHEMVLVIFLKKAATPSSPVIETAPIVRPHIFTSATVVMIRHPRTIFQKFYSKGDLKRRAAALFFFVSAITCIMSIKILSGQAVAASKSDVWLMDSFSKPA